MVDGFALVAKASLSAQLEDQLKVCGKVTLADAAGLKSEAV
jgi:hypothetical protein